MTPLFFQTETIESIVLLLPLCTLLLMGDFAVDRDGRFLHHEEKGISRRQTDATRWITSVLHYPPNIYCYRTGKKELWTMNWRNVRGSLPVPFLSHCTLIHTGLWFVLHCLILTENSMSPSVFRIRWNKQVHIFALREWGIGIAMWSGLIKSFEVTLVSKLIKYLMPIIHFNHGRWHLLPELWSILTTVLLKGHNPRKACCFLQTTQFKTQNISRTVDFNYLKKQRLTFVLIWHSSKAQSTETTARHRTTHPTLPFLLPPHPPLLTQLMFPPPLLPPPEQCKKGVPLCLPLMASVESDCAWNVTGRLGEGMGEVFICS